MQNLCSVIKNEQYMSHENVEKYVLMMILLLFLQKFSTTYSTFPQRELFVGTQFSNLYISVDTPARAATYA
jgi:hypothetical protein